MSIIFTLFENDYHFGVGSLLNSLIQHEFQGKLVIAYRGELPSWMIEAKKQSFENHEIIIEFDKVNTTKHLAQIKPDYALKILDDYKNEQNYYYFDPDIIVSRPWSFFEEWTQFGFTLVEEEIKWRMHESHPQRLMWAKWAQENGFNVKRWLGQYFNSGFFSYKKNHREILELWSQILDIAVNSGYSSDEIVRGIGNIFSTWDQDALNLALMLSEVPISTMGPEEMGFRGGGVTMQHATGGNKPWKSCHTKLALYGKSPRYVDVLYARNINNPIRFASNKYRNLKSFDIYMAKILSKLIN